MKVLNHIKTSHTRGIPLLAFNRKGQYVASIGQDENSSLLVYDWAKEIEVLSAPITKSKILCLTYMQFDSTLFVAPNSQGSNNDQDLKKGATKGPPSSLSQPVNTSFMLPTEDVIVIGGQRHLQFSWAQGHNIISQNAIWGSEKKDVIMALASATPNICVTGSVKGMLLIWRNFKVSLTHLYCLTL